jgi:hypothetical protein
MEYRKLWIMTPTRVMTVTRGMTVASSPADAQGGDRNRSSPGGRLF